MSRRALVIGATGYLGGHLTSALVNDGWGVAGSARDAQGAAKVAARGATPVLLPDLTDRDALHAAVAAADAVIYAAQLLLEPEQQALTLIADLLEGRGGTLVMTSGTSVLTLRTQGEASPVRVAEDDPFEPLPWLAMRVETENQVRARSNDRLRTMVIRPPLIYGNGGSTQIPAIFDSVREKGVACYVGSGLNQYSYVHVDDLAGLYVLALDKASGGALYHAAAGDIPSFKAVAEAVAEVRGCNTRSLSLEEATALWGKFNAHAGLGGSSRSIAERSREELGWAPSRPDPIADIRAGAYAPMARAG